MDICEEPLRIAVDGHDLAGTLVASTALFPGVLFVHGWQGNQLHYLARARALARLGCVCLTFNLRGHGDTDGLYEQITREDSLRDVLAAYDTLATTRTVDRNAIAVVGSSYGGYLAAILTTLRQVKWLGLRAPALYKDEDWHLPKQRLDKDEVAAYRRERIDPRYNRALRACSEFEGDVLIVESEADDVVPHPVIANYQAAFTNAHSLTYRVIEGADHALSNQLWQTTYTRTLEAWAAEMIVGVGSVTMQSS